MTIRCWPSGTFPPQQMNSRVTLNFIYFYSFLAVPAAYENSQARDWIWGAAETHVTAMGSARSLSHGATVGCPKFRISDVKWLLQNFYSFFFFSSAASLSYRNSQARGRIGAAAAGLCHSHSQARSELHLWPTPQLTTTPDPWPTECSQGLNLHPHGY